MTALENATQKKSRITEEQGGPVTLGGWGLGVGPWGLWFCERAQTWDHLLPERTYPGEEEARKGIECVRMFSETSGREADKGTGVALLWGWWLCARPRTGGGGCSSVFLEPQPRASPCWQVVCLGSWLCQERWLHCAKLKSYILLLSGVRLNVILIL